MSISFYPSSGKNVEENIFSSLFITKSISHENIPFPKQASATESKIPLNEEQTKRLKELNIFFIPLFPLHEMKEDKESLPEKALFFEGFCQRLMEKCAKTECKIADIHLGTQLANHIILNIPQRNLLSHLEICICPAPSETLCFTEQKALFLKLLQETLCEFIDVRKEMSPILKKAAQYEKPKISESQSISDEIPNPSFSQISSYLQEHYLSIQEDQDTFLVSLKNLHIHFAATEKIIADGKTLQLSLINRDYLPLKEHILTAPDNSPMHNLLTQGSLKIENIISVVTSSLMSTLSSNGVSSSPCVNYELFEKVLSLYFHQKNFSLDPFLDALDQINPQIKADTLIAFFSAISRSKKIKESLKATLKGLLLTLINKTIFEEDCKKKLNSSDDIFENDSKQIRELQDTVLQFMEEQKKENLPDTSWQKRIFIPATMGLLLQKTHLLHKNPELFSFYVTDHFLSNSSCPTEKEVNILNDTLYNSLVYIDPLFSTAIKCLNALLQDPAAARYLADRKKLCQIALDNFFMSKQEDANLELFDSLPLCNELICNEVTYEDPSTQTICCLKNFLLALLWQNTDLSLDLALAIFMQIHKNPNFSIYHLHKQTIAKELLEKITSFPTRANEGISSYFTLLIHISKGLPDSLFRDTIQFLQNLVEKLSKTKNPSLYPISLLLIEQILKEPSLPLSLWEKSKICEIGMETLLLQSCHAHFHELIQFAKNLLETGYHQYFKISNYHRLIGHLGKMQSISSFKQATDLFFLFLTSVKGENKIKGEMFTTLKLHLQRDTAFKGVYIDFLKRASTMQAAGDCLFQPIVDSLTQLLESSNRTKAFNEGRTIIQDLPASYRQNPSIIKVAKEYFLKSIPFDVTSLDVQNNVKELLSFSSLKTDPDIHRILWQNMNIFSKDLQEEVFSTLFTLLSKAKLSSSCKTEIRNKYLPFIKSSQDALSSDLSEEKRLILLGKLQKILMCITAQEILVQQELFSLFFSFLKTCQKSPSLQVEIFTILLKTNALPILFSYEIASEDFEMFYTFITQSKASNSIPQDTYVMLLQKLSEILAKNTRLEDNQKEKIFTLFISLASQPETDLAAFEKGCSLLLENKMKLPRSYSAKLEASFGEILPKIPLIPTPNILTTVRGIYGNFLSQPLQCAHFPFLTRFANLTLDVNDLTDREAKDNFFQFYIINLESLLSKEAAAMLLRQNPEMHLLNTLVQSARDLLENDVQNNREILKRYLSIALAHISFVSVDQKLNEEHLALRVLAKSARNIHTSEYIDTIFSNPLWQKSAIAPIGKALVFLDFVEGLQSFFPTITQAKTMLKPLANIDPNLWCNTDLQLRMKQFFLRLILQSQTVADLSKIASLYGQIFDNKKVQNGPLFTPFYLFFVTGIKDMVIPLEETARREQLDNKTRQINLAFWYWIKEVAPKKDAEMAITGKRILLKVMEEFFIPDGEVAKGNENKPQIIPYLQLFYRYFTDAAKENNDIVCETVKESLYEGRIINDVITIRCRGYNVKFMGCYVFGNKTYANHPETLIELIMNTMHAEYKDR